MPRGILHQVEVTDDCRASRRLPINRSVRYTILGEKKKLRHVGLGKTLNMSAGGVLFTTESPLPEGERIELVVSWLARFNDALPVKLVLTGRLVRSGAAQAAMSIDRYEFRTWLT
jgi:PilZ domain